MAEMELEKGGARVTLFEVEDSGAWRAALESVSGCWYPAGAPVSEAARGVLRAAQRLPNMEIGNLWHGIRAAKLLAGDDLDPGEFVAVCNVCFLVLKAVEQMLDLTGMRADGWRLGILGGHFGLWPPRE